MDGDSTAAPGPYVTPPPAGYPMSEDNSCEQYSQNHVAIETKSRGDDGFCKNWCALLGSSCCCCCERCC